MATLGVSDAIPAMGTTLEILTTLPSTYTLIGELTNIGGMSLGADTIEVTNHQSLDGWEEFVAGVKRSGEVSIEGNFVPTDLGQLELIEMINSGAKEVFRITFPFADPYIWSFGGLVTEFTPDAPFDAAATFSGTIKVSGKPSLLQI
jgi:predicted secreted protein